MKEIIKEENNTQFSVKYCVLCKKSWEMVSSKKNKETGKMERNIIVHLDFPTYGLRRKVCYNCIKKQEMRENENYQY